jgi:hypothetical protein
MPRLGYRQRGLYQASILSKVAEASSALVAQRGRWSSSSRPTPVITAGATDARR